jgi:hypothetical protein
VKMRAVTAQNCFKIVYYFFLCTLYIYCWPVLSSEMEKM